MYSKKKKLGKVLFFGRKDCFYTNKIKALLKTKSKKFFYLESSKVGEEIKKNYLNLKVDYIFCFRSFYILKKSCLKNASKAVINFHPGTPEYRGIGSVNYAIFNNSKYYGCTAHLVNNKIDNGKIVDVKKFKISKKDSIEKILIKTYKIMTRQAIYIINKINENSQVLDKFINKNKKFKWSKNIKKLKDLNKFYEIKNNISRKIFFKKIRATQTKNFKPYIFIHGKKFILE